MALSRHTSTPLAALHKACDGRALTVTSALSVEVLDRAGDVVVPRGVDLRVHKADPWAGLEHYRHKGGEWVLPGPGEDHLPPVRVGTARDPDGRYGVVLKNMPGHGEVLFATTRFDPSDQLSLQTYRLVEDGTLDGTSVEIALLKGYHRPLDKSPLENRYGQHIERCTLLGYAHCAVPVNQAARVCKSLPPAAEARIRLAQTGKLGSEPLHPVLMKSFARHLPGKSTSVVGGFGRVEKAMPDSAEMTPAYAPEANDTADSAPEAEGGTPTPQAAYTLAQGLEDVASQVEELLGKGEHVKGIAKLRKLLDEVEDLQADALAVAQMVEGDLSGKDEGEEEPVAEDATKPDDDGYLKGIPQPLRKSIRRFTLAEVRKAATVAPAPEPPADPDEAFFADLKQSDPREYRRQCRLAREYAEANR